MGAIEFAAFTAIAVTIGYAFGFIRGAFWSDDWAMEQLIEERMKMAKKILEADHG